MQDKNLAFSAMLLSVVFFALIGFTAYYPLLEYLAWNNELSEIGYHFLLRFEALQKPLPSRGILLMCVVGSVMLYHPLKKEGKTLVTGVIVFWPRLHAFIVNGLFTGIRTRTALVFPDPVQPWISFLSFGRGPSFSSHGLWQ